MIVISINSPNWLALLLPSYSHWDLLFIFNSSFLNQPEPTSSHACNQQNYCCKTDRSLESSCTTSISWCLWSWYYRICLTNNDIIWQQSKELVRVEQHKAFHWLFKRFRNRQICSLYDCCLALRSSWIPCLYDHYLSKKYSCKIFI